MSNAEIAETLVVSEATIKTHVAGILAKLELHNRAQAVVFAYEFGHRPGGRRIGLRILIRGRTVGHCDEPDPPRPKSPGVTPRKRLNRLVRCAWS